MIRAAVVLALSALIAGCGDQEADSSARWTDGVLRQDPPQPSPWYTSAQVSGGAALFQTHCASCHGAKAQGTEKWKVRDKNGHLPPPPLDGSAHAWHHSLEVLRNVVRHGGSAFNGTMPAFEDKLDTAQIDQVLAWVQSNWPPETNRQWHKINTRAR